MSSLILYPSNETAFDSNGIGTLSDVVDDEVYEELNGQYELTVQYPVEGIHFSDIVTDAYITAKPNPVSDPQPFRIYRITKPMKGSVTIYARHYAYRNKKIVVSPFTASSAVAALQNLKNNAVNDCPFEFWTDKATSAEMKVPAPKDIWTLLGGSEGSVLDTYGGEYEFDKSTVKLWNRRGADRGVSIRYGKNLTDLKQDENIADVCTGVYPYWIDAGGNLVQLPEKYISASGTYEEEKIMPLDLSSEFAAKPTVAQLRERAERYIKDNDIGKPDVSWTVEFLQLEQTEEYKGKALLERVLLGDTVSVIFPKLNVDASARAVAARYKPTLERYKSITLGKVKANLATTIVKQAKAIESKPTMTQLEQARAAATEWLTNGSGYVLHRRDEAGNAIDTLYMDAPDVNAAVNVMLLSKNGIGFSHTGVNGPYTSAWTIDGTFNADVILTGTLFGILIKACRIESASGKVSLDLSDETKSVTFNTGISTNGLTVRADKADAERLFSVGAYKASTGDYFAKMGLWGADGAELFSLVETFSDSEIVGILAKLIGRKGFDVVLAAGENKAGIRIYHNDKLAGYFDVVSTAGYRNGDGYSYLITDWINHREVYWEDNGDGTCTMKGRIPDISV